MALDIDTALIRLVEAGGSDLHLKVPSTPMMRVDGDLRPVDGLAALEECDTTAAVDHMLGADEVKRREFADHGEVDFSYAIPGVARFRVNAFRQRGWCSIVCRAIPVSIRTIDDLALPPVIRDLAEEERGSCS